MKVQNILAAVAFFAVSASASAVPTNLVTNGDFSQGGTGWTLSGNTGYNSYPSSWTNGAVGSNAILSQAISTIAGHTYEVRFDTFVNWGSMASSLDGIVFFSTPTSGSFVASVVAARNNATLSFITRNDPSFNSLDNVSVVDVTPSQVPEPGSLALIGLGMLGLGALRKRSA